MTRIGLFGGSFDPVHRAHVALAHAALAATDTLALDRVRWVPTGRPWQKARAITPAEHRVAMLREAIAHEPRFELSLIEIERAGASYTLDTVRALSTAEPGVQWVLLIGQDQYTGLHSWHGWQELLARVELAVARRPGETREPHPELRAHPHRMVPLPMLDISSTEVRRRVALGQDITELVPPEVARYIDLHRLYLGAPEAGTNTHGS